MKYYFNILLFLLIGFSGFSQVNPKNFAADTTPGDSTTIYSNEGGVNFDSTRKAYFIDMQTYFFNEFVISGDTLYGTDQKYALLAPYLDNTDAQDLTLTSNTLALTGDATSVDLSGYLDNTDSQDLSLSNNTLSLTGDGTSVSLVGYLDSVGLVQDSIIVYYRNSVEISRDTISVSGGGGGGSDSDWTASGSNYYNTSSKFSIGTSTAAKKLTIEDGSEQLQLRNSASNRATLSVNSSGYFSVDATAKRYGFGVGAPAFFMQGRNDNNGATVFSLLNNTSGTGAYSGLELTTDAAVKLKMRLFSGTYTSSGINQPYRGVIEQSGSGGLVMMATHSSGEVHFGAGGSASSDIQLTIDSDGVEIANLMKLTPTATVPSTPASGWLYMDDGTNTGGTPALRYYNGTSWIDL